MLAGCIRLCTRLRSRPHPGILAAALAGGAALAGPTAHADDRAPVSIDWQRLTEAFRPGGSIVSPEATAFSHSARLEAAKLESADDPDARSPSCDASLVARDWDGARLFVGHLSPMDQVRLSRSSRMLVGRLRMTAARVVPFAQLGLGQWRNDAEAIPRRRDVEYAAQLGYGLEIALSSRAAVAFEADYTLLYRDLYGAPRSSSAGLWGTFLAARASF